MKVEINFRNTTNFVGFASLLGCLYFNFFVFMPGFDRVFMMDGVMSQGEQRFHDTSFVVLGMITMVLVYGWYKEWYVSFVDYEVARGTSSVNTPPVKRPR